MLSDREMRTALRQKLAKLQTDVRKVELAIAALDGDEEVVERPRRASPKIQHRRDVGGALRLRAAFATALRAHDGATFEELAKVLGLRHGSRDHYRTLHLAHNGRARGYFARTNTGQWSLGKKPVPQPEAEPAPERNGASEPASRGRTQGGKLKLSMAG